MSVFADIAVTTTATLDLWLPEAAPRATLLWLHGGGFLKGSRKEPVAAALAERLLPQGVAVASGDYVLSGSAASLPAGMRAEQREFSRQAQQAGLRMARRLHGPAFAAALLDASALVAALAGGAAHAATAGRPVIVAGHSAGGILALSLAYPPQQWATRIAPPQAVLALAAALVHPWALRAGGPPARLLVASRDRIVPPADAAIGAQMAAERRADLVLVETGIAGHNQQIAALFDGLDQHGHPWFALLERLIEAAAEVS